MSKRTGLIGAAVATLAALSLAANASAYQYTIEDPNGLLTPTQTTAIERAISWQVNTQVAKFWPVDPVSFVPSGGVPITIAPTTAETATWCENQFAAGCHYNIPTEDQSGNQYGRQGLWIIVEGADGFADSQFIDHELIETEVDPQINNYIDGQLVEVCDPMAPYTYTGLGGVKLQDFALPAYFTHAAGPKNFLRWRQVNTKRRVRVRQARQRRLDRQLARRLARRFARRARSSGRHEGSASAR